MGLSHFRMNSTSVFGVALCKFAGQSIGHDIPVTLFFFFCGIFYWSGSHTFAYAWLQMCVKLARLSGGNYPEATRDLKRLKLALTISWLFSLTSYIPVLIIIGVPEWQTECHISLMNQRLVCMFTCTIIITYHGRRLHKLLSQGLDTLTGERAKQRTEVLHRLSQISAPIIRQTFVETALGQMMTFWPYLRTKFTYTLPLSWFMATIG
jgi:hypothetical protein